jgi:hypothetical protein
MERAGSYETSVSLYQHTPHPNTERKWRLEEFDRKLKADDNKVSWWLADSALLDYFSRHCPYEYPSPNAVQTQLENCHPELVVRLSSK